MLEPLVLFFARFRMFIAHTLRASVHKFALVFVFFRVRLVGTAPI